MLSNTPIRASVLAIGTEITTGQILNGNARWISQQLWRHGIATTHHLTVPDDRPLILQSLRFLEGNCELLYITGGLGPTVDDFTREVIADWASAALEFDESSWQELSERLQSRGLTAYESHRQQCYFPRGSRILKNPVGTAKGFSVQVGATKAVILPGPPKEVEGIWKDSIEADLMALAPQLDPGRTWSWDCIGQPESEIAALAESVLVGCPFEKAYRVHLPYVEFKLTARESERAEMKKWADAVTRVLAPWTITRNGEDAAMSLGARWHALNAPLTVVDEATGSFLLERLAPATRTLRARGHLQFLSRDLATGDGWKFHIKHGTTEHSCTVVCEGPTYQRQSWVVTTPAVWLKFPEREAQYWSEMAIVHWLKALQP